MDLNYINNLPKPIAAPDTGPGFARPDVEGMKEGLFAPPVNPLRQSMDEARQKLNQQIAIGQNYSLPENERVTNEAYQFYENGDFTNMYKTIVRNLDKFQPRDEHVKDMDESSPRNAYNSLLHQNIVAQEEKERAMREGTGIQGFWKNVGERVQDLLGREGTPQYAGQKAYWQALSMGMGLPGASKAYMDVYDATMKHQQQLALSQAKFDFEKGPTILAANDAINKAFQPLSKIGGFFSDNELSNLIQTGKAALLSTDKDAANAWKFSTIQQLANKPGAIEHAAKIADAAEALGITVDNARAKVAEQLVGGKGANRVTQADAKLYKYGLQQLIDPKKLEAMNERLNDLESGKQASTIEGVATTGPYAGPIQIHSRPGFGTGKVFSTTKQDYLTPEEIQRAGIQTKESPEYKETVARREAEGKEEGKTTSEYKDKIYITSGNASTKLRENSQAFAILDKYPNLTAVLQQSKSPEVRSLLTALQSGIKIGNINLGVDLTNALNAAKSEPERNAIAALQQIFAGKVFTAVQEAGFKGSQSDKELDQIKARVGTTDTPEMALRAYLVKDNADAKVAKLRAEYLDKFLAANNNAFSRGKFEAEFDKISAPVYEEARKEIDQLLKLKNTPRASNEPGKEGVIERTIGGKKHRFQNGEWKEVK